MNYKKIAKFDITKKFLGFFRGKKSVIADKNNTDKVCHIYVYGFMHNSGATHFCLCFASFLKRKKRNVICIRHNDTSDYRAVTDKGTLCNEKPGLILYLIIMAASHIICQDMSI